MTFGLFPEVEFPLGRRKFQSRGRQSCDGPLCEEPGKEMACSCLKSGKNGGKSVLEPWSRGGESYFEKERVDLRDRRDDFFYRAFLSLLFEQPSYKSATFRN